MPVVDSTKAFVHCVSDLRRFVMTVDQRFQNLSSTVAQGNMDQFTTMENFKGEVNDIFEVQAKQLTA